MGADWCGGEESPGAAPGNECFRKKVETENKESRSKRKRTHDEKNEIKPDGAIHVPSDGGWGWEGEQGAGRGRKPLQNAMSAFLTFCSVCRLRTLGPHASLRGPHTLGSLL